LRELLFLATSLDKASNPFECLEKYYNYFLENVFWFFFPTPSHNKENNPFESMNKYYKKKNQINFSLELFFPLWELESRWTPKSSNNNFRGQISLYWKFYYIIERGCLKWAHMTHLGTWNTSYGQKKGRESNWQFDS
jgi:hypothetical protein